MFYIPIPNWLSTTSQQHPTRHFYRVARVQLIIIRAAQMESIKFKVKLE